MTFPNDNIKINERTKTILNEIDEKNRVYNLDFFREDFKEEKPRSSSLRTLIDIWSNRNMNDDGQLLNEDIYLK